MISKIIRTSSSSNLIKYIANGEAHNSELTNERCLAVGAKNVDKIAKKYDALYTSTQFTAVQQKAKNKHKKTKAYHIIFSFSADDFPLPKSQKELKKQADQAGILIAGFLSKDLPKNSQCFLGVQRDGKGKMLHVHVALNSVKLDGKVLNTNQIRLLDKGKEKGLRSRLDAYLVNNFERITGRKYTPVRAQEDNLVNSSEAQIKSREEAKNGTGYAWKEHLKALIYNAFDASDSLDTFKQALLENGVSIKERRAGIGKDKNGKKLYRKAYTYAFTGEDGKKHSIRDFAQTKNGGLRGLGKAFMPSSLEKEFENGRNITQEQIAEKLEQQSRSRQISTTNSSRNTARSQEANSFMLDTSRFTRDSKEFADGDKSTNDIDKFVNYDFERQLQQATKVQNIRLDLSEIERINDRIDEIQTNTKRKRQQRKQQLRQHAKSVQHANEYTSNRQSSRTREHGRRLDNGLDF